MVKPQYIYKAIDFIFEDSTQAPKYFVVFHTDEESTLLFSLTTSKSKLPANLDDPNTEGCVHFSDDRGYGHCYIWKPGTVIGGNGFSFSLRTYVNIEFKAQLKEVASSNISKQATKRIEECCCLSDSEFLNVLSCLLKSRYLKGKHRKAISATMQTLQASLAK